MTMLYLDLFHGEYNKNNDENKKKTMEGFVYTIMKMFNHHQFPSLKHHNIGDAHKTSLSFYHNNFFPQHVAIHQLDNDSGKKERDLINSNDISEYHCHYNNSTNTSGKNSLNRTIPVFGAEQYDYDGIFEYNGAKETTTTMMLNFKKYKRISLDFLTTPQFVSFKGKRANHEQDTTKDPGLYKKKTKARRLSRKRKKNDGMFDFIVYNTHINTMVVDNSKKEIITT